MGVFDKTVAEAIEDIQTHGFDNLSRINEWITRIREAAIKDMVPEQAVQSTLARTLETVYTRMVEKGGYIKAHPDIGRFSIDKIKPRLRQDLDRRIHASANLIKLNRDRAVESTIQRFSGWTSSVPVGGSTVEPKKEIKDEITKDFKTLTYEERRVAIDQSHKLIADINNVIASDNGAIAMKWRSQYRQAGYNYRQDHRERDDKIYLIRDSWAHKAGLVKPGSVGYTDEVTRPGEEVFCRCSGVYIYVLRRLPESMLTVKGQKALESSAISGQPK